MEEDEGLSVRDVIKEIYISLKGAIGRKELELPKRVEVIIDEKFDQHRTDYSSMYYKTVVLADFEGTGYILGHGEPGTNYASRAYDGDILLTRFSWKGVGSREKLIRQVTECLEYSRCFCNSLLYGKRNNVLVFTNYLKTLDSLMKKLFIEKFSNFSSQEEVVVTLKGEDLILQAQESRGDSAIKFKPEFIGFITDALKNGFYSEDA